MSQETLVLVVPAEVRGALRARLGEGDFEYRTVPHAELSAKGEGVVATLYRSGKLVIQGAQPAAFAARYLPEVELPADAAAGGAAEIDDRPLVGSDESGKGDVFGPLVVASVRLEAGDAAKLRQGGIADSKKKSDAAILRLAPALRATFPCAVEVLDPPEYNAGYARIGNLNTLLARQHVRAIERVARPGDRVLVDQFADAKLLEREASGLDIELDQRPRAEREMAVAAASIVAREAFLERLAALSDAWACDLAKGAGPPAEEALLRFVELHGPERLGEVAKLHFRTIQRLLGR